MNWLIKGCLDWQKHGLTNPESVIRANAAYREESDVLKKFLDEFCIISTNAEIAKNDLHEAYMNWAKNNGERYLNKTKFGTAMLQKGFSDYRESGGNRKSFWKGLKLS